MKIVSRNESWKGRGKKERTPCPRCKNFYMQSAYIYISDQEKKKWEKIGEYCASCGHFLPALRP
ncbi:MAG: hypothetical protein KJ714_05635 [Euryarchaeota archaeon]|nr:hypothetical protein [Euryarchaeota archaeon]